jgi:dipeptidyl-peptidase III
MISLLDAGDEFLVLKHSEGTLDDLTIQLDESKMLSHGKPAVGKLLQKLHIYRLSVDVKRGTKLLQDLTEVDDFFLKVREVVLKKKQPRKLFVHPNTELRKDGSVSFKDYSLSNLGIIQSWAERGV